MPINSVNAAIVQDPLIQELVKAKGKLVEIIAFGISYVGTLKELDVDDGYAIISDGDDEAMLELERIESVTIIEENHE